jgi:N-acetylglucosamine-6-phosphate deacetylase
MGMGTFQLGGQTVVVGEDGAAWSADRTHLVGSTATLSQLRRVLTDVGQSDAAIDRLLAINPARALAAAAARGSHTP